MAFSKKPSPSVVLVVLMLLVTQHAYALSQHAYVQSPPPSPSPHCKLGCFLRCIALIVSPTFVACVGACFVGICGTRIKTISHPSFHCGVGCIRSKCSDPGAENGNVSEECVSSCVGGCDASFVGDTY